MSRFSITIGNNVFPSKTAALKFYKQIFDKYSFGESLNDEDAKHIISLAFKDTGSSDEVDEFAEGVVSGLGIFPDELNENKILNVMVVRHPEFRTTKCFCFVGQLDGEKHEQLFSYRMAISGVPSDLRYFSSVCRFSVRKRTRNFKIEQFKNRPVQCAVSGNIVEWEECQVDHKAPLTFSVIVKAFIAANDLDVSSIDYAFENSMGVFSDPALTEKFDEFHKKMAVLRIISINENLKLSSSARVKPTRKDGTLNN
ncbi:DUF3223 domain-containing protein [Oceanobacter sp. 5_MG-2023]|uniref:DUF3223 domain-containing protein n=1 Tax=Oceanobacter sp. 5_MG-2023 TaxID=3062645 RepID=UPI0026E20E7E|nr:DUF3223 domain-containing protein [Oceanobacter sp. 5_MG-2023]MDO6680661.1 DUF3223 domain-containing protein [Oceanobacter sp. 5_MG-2023]